MKDIRLFIKWICGVVTLGLMLLPTQWGMAQQEIHEVNGQVSIRIESKFLTLEEANQHIQKKDSIPLRVSLIFKGHWVSLFDNNYEAYLNECSFSYGLTSKGGTNSTDAPLYTYTDDIPAWMLAYRAFNCATPSGSPLRVPLSQQGYITRPGWFQVQCPTYAYGAGFSSDDAIPVKKVDNNGDPYYEVDLFAIYFKLKRLEPAVYVRGIDINGMTDPSNTDLATADLDGTSGTTELNIMNPDDSKPIYWPGAPNTQAADWTLAPADYYGGVIPGGIFIEQVPVVAQFERSFMA